ncbi:CCA tRNA nucleotidyltransferase [Metallosphaera tengchongensis]|uniref:CCA-adding enzyme n=1 Tax=Metallosphaera tengchongensis TaxID=1532350 RepID=A0A6N0NRT0_9CREN|nr:CCA tRNA nucleotidyltransferase [Metallosphaera tengchongensis]QKQ99421.1 CCA tRNA nucleotidyltransferase [Metallosphaera tengchongensis]
MTEEVQGILNEVLRRVKPGKDEERKLSSAADKVLNLLSGLDAEVHGSFRKGTWLKGDTDVDVFVFFPKEMGKEGIKDRGLALIHERLSKLNTRLAYAEHPYLIVEVDGVEIDVVPALRVDRGDQAITAVDRTPFHTKYVEGKLNEDGRDQVRILKRFLKGIGVYGAEIRVMGFSGYVSELLTIYYGSFLKVLEGSSKWRERNLIVLEGMEREFDSPLIIPDPVDPRRNAAAAVSLKSLSTFSIASRAFLRSPSLNFFFPRPPEGQEVQGEVIVTEVKLNEPYVDDVLWGQLRRTAEKVRNSLTSAGFKVMDIGICQGETVKILVQLETSKVGEFFLSQGPPFYLEQALSFVDANDKVWVGEDGRLYTLRRRKQLSPERVILESISLKYAHTVSQYTLQEAEGNCERSFLRKTPTWLK